MVRFSKIRELYRCLLNSFQLLPVLLRRTGLRFPTFGFPCPLRCLAAQEQMGIIHRLDCKQTIPCVGHQLNGKRVRLGAALCEQRQRRTRGNERRKPK